MENIFHTPEEYRQAEVWLTQLDLETWILTKYSQECRNTARLIASPPPIQFGAVSQSSPEVLATVIFPESLRKKGALV